MPVIGSLELVLDDDGAAVVVLRLDVDAEFADSDLCGHDRQRPLELLSREVDVLGKPGREITCF